MTPGSRLRRLAGVCLSATILVSAAGPAAQGSAPNRALLDRIWKDSAAAETRHSTVCGTIVETRTSPLLARPVVARGTYCFAGTDRFRIEYTAPTPLRVLYNAGVLNVSADGGVHTEAMDVGNNVARAQSYFGGPGAAATLERDFSIEATESAARFVMRLAPRAGRVARRVTGITIELGKADMLPRRIIIAGKNQVISTFDVTVDRVNTPLPRSTFDVYDPRPGPRPRR